MNISFATQFAKFQLPASANAVASSLNFVHPPNSLRQVISKGAPADRLGPEGLLQSRRGRCHHRQGAAAAGIGAGLIALQRQSLECSPNLPNANSFSF